jgi:hypothetical protein
MNPYFKGITDEQPNAGRVHRYPTKENMICDIEQMHGLECKNSNFKLYYEPKKIGDIDIVFDLTSTSLRNDYIKSLYELEKIIEEVLLTNYSNVFFIELFNLKNKNYSPILEIPNSKKIQVNSIFEYCDTITSSKNFVGLQSGGSHLAKTYQDIFKYKITLIEPVWFDGWRFDNINYKKIN